MSMFDDNFQPSGADRDFNENAVVAANRFFPLARSAAAPIDQRTVSEWDGVAQQVLKMINGVDATVGPQFLEEARLIAAEWEAGFKNSPHALLDPALEVKLHNYCQDTSVQQALSDLTSLTIQVLERISIGGTPGHDRRHFLIKDPLDGLAYTLEDNLEGYKRTHILPTLLHDVGQIPMAWITAEQPSGVLGADHAQVGFMLAKKIYDLFSDGIPQELRDQHLYAILTHQVAKGELVDNNFLAQAVQRADREQLIGAEAALRFIAFDTHFTGCSFSALYTEEEAWQLSKQLPLPGTAEDKILFHHIEFYMRNLFRQHGSRGEERASQRKAISAMFLYLAATDDARQVIFAPEFARASGVPLQDQHWSKSKFVPENVWAAIQQGPAADIQERMNKLKLDAGALKELLFIALTPSLATSPKDLGCDLESSLLIGKYARPAWETIERNIDQLSETEAERFFDGVAYALAMREVQDQEGLMILQQIRNRFAPHEPEHQIATAITNNWQDGAGRLIL